MNSRSSRTLTLLAAAAVALAAMALYWGTLQHGFVYDDLVIVQNNPNMREPGNALRLFSPDYFPISGERSFRPLNTLTYIADAALWRGAARGFHLTNVLLHAACAALLFFLMLRLTQSRVAALLGALLFAAHPLNTEAVSPVTFREDMLALLFVTAGLLAYARWRDAPPARAGRRRLAALAALAFLGLGGKESAVILLPAVFVYDWLMFPEMNIEDRAVRMAPAAGVLCAAAAVFFALYFFLGQYSGGGASAYPGGSPAAALPVMASAFTRYFYLFLAPFNLCADYSQNYALGWTLQAVLGAALIVLLPAAGFAVRRVLPATAFGVFFFVLAFVPVSNVVPFGAVFAERYAYMPNAGLCIAVAALLLERPRMRLTAPGSPERSRTVYVLLLAALCAGFGVMTVRRAAVWRSSAALWRNTVGCCHDCARPHVNYGRALLEDGKPDQARKILEFARKLDAQNFQVWIALGRAYADLGRADQAIHAYESAIRLDPRVKYPYYNLALVYEDRAQYYLAEMNLIKALKRDPDYLDARLALANVLFKKQLLSPPEIELLQHNLARIRDALPASEPRRIEAEKNYHMLMQVLERGRAPAPSEPR